MKLTEKQMREISVRARHIQGKVSALQSIRANPMSSGKVLDVLTDIQRELIDMAEWLNENRVEKKSRP